jgi:small subunit ribosomal protein S17
MGTAVERGERRTKEGVVVSSKMDKTVVVRVERLTRHPVYKKVQRRGRTFKAHDEDNDCREGDRVVITECRPLSKEKSWRVTQIVSRAK